jgi:tetratricopeptide (TPR) repeat protein
MDSEKKQEPAGLDMLKQDISAPAGLFDRQEAALFRRIEKFENHSMPWEAVAAADEAVSPFCIDNAEKKLFDRISQTDSAEPWELYLKQDTQKSDIETSAGAIAAKAKKQAFAVSFPVLFSSVSFVFVKNRVVSMLLLAALVSATAFLSWNHFAGKVAPLQTVAVLSEQGKTPSTEKVVRESETVSTLPGQRMVLSNMHGMVVIENASIAIRRARPDQMDYAVAFSDSSQNPAGQVLFSVTKKKDGREFSASTRDYIVHVVGTIFTIRPQEHGRTALEVLEGVVRVEGAGIAAIVSAGSTFAFNDSANSYLIDQSSDTGHVVIHTPQPVSDTAHQSIPGTPPIRQKREIRLRQVTKPPTLSYDSLLQRAALLETSDWKKAIAAYNEVLSRTGSTSYSREIALFSIGRLRADHNAPAAEVREAFNEYLKEYPKASFAGESYLRLADLEYKSDPSRALAWYEKYLQDFPGTQNTAAAEYKAGLIYLEQKKQVKAVAMLSNALRHAKNYPPDQIAAMQQVLDNAQNARNDSSRNSLPK